MLSIVAGCAAAGVVQAIISASRRVNRVLRFPLDPSQGKPGANRMAIGSG
jgi:hypothetical protein